MSTNPYFFKVFLPSELLGESLERTEAFQFVLHKNCVSRVWTFKKTNTRLPCFCYEIIIFGLILKMFLRPWPGWLSWLDVPVQRKRLWVLFPVRARTWAAGSIPGWARMGGNQSMFSLSLSLSPFLSLQKL